MLRHSSTFGIYAIGNTLVGLAMRFGHNWPGGTIFMSFGLGCGALWLQYMLRERRQQRAGL